MIKQEQICIPPSSTNENKSLYVKKLALGWATGVRFPARTQNFIFAHMARSSPNQK
jgi:hypothetical protein